MFTTTRTYTVDPDGKYCGNCTHCVYNDGGDTYPLYWCGIFEDELPTDSGTKWCPRLPRRLQACIDAEFDSTIDEQLSNQNGQNKC